MAHAREAGFATRHPLAALAEDVPLASTHSTLSLVINFPWAPLGSNSYLVQRAARDWGVPCYGAPYHSSSRPSSLSSPQCHLLPFLPSFVFYQNILQGGGICAFCYFPFSFFVLGTCAGPTVFRILPASFLLLSNHNCER